MQAQSPEVSAEKGTTPAITSAAQLTQLLENVRCLHDISAELIAADVFSQLAEPAGEREAFEAWFDESVKPSVSYGSPDILRRSNLPAFQAGAAWQRTQAAGVPEGWKLVKIGHGCVTSSMKAACIGEFSFGITMACGECVDCGVDSDCPVCGGEVEYTQRITVPWDTCKEIYKAMLAAAPAQPAAHDQGEVHRLREALESCLELIETISPFEDDTVRKARAALSAQQPSQGEGGAQ